MDATDFLLSRRSYAAKALTAPAPEGDGLGRLLTAAVRVPDHGMLEPWRFLVLSGAGLARVAAAIRARAAASGQDADKGATLYERVPLVVAVVASPKESPKIPAIEQTLSAGAVALGLVNAALAEGWGAAWITGWPAYDRPLLEETLGLAPQEWIAGFVALGTGTVPSDRPRPDVAALVTRIDV